MLVRHNLATKEVEGWGGEEALAPLLLDATVNST